MKRTITFAIMLSMSVLGVLGRQRQPLEVDTSHVWSLQDCMHFAIGNSPIAVRQQLSNANTKTTYTQAILGHLPNLGASSGGSIGFGRGLDPETNTYTTNTNFNSDIGANTNITIFNGLSLLNNTRIRKIQTLRGDEQLKQVEDDISLATLRAYFDFIYQLGTMRLAREQVDAARENLIQGQRMMELGLRGIADVAQLEATLAGDEYNLVTIDNGVRNTELRLKKEMNYPPSEKLKIDTTQRYAVPAPEITELSEIVDNAVVTLPGILISEMNVRISELDLVTAKASLFPSLSAGGRIGTGYSTPLGEFKNSATSFQDQMTNKLNYGVSATLSIPIFNAWNRQFNIRRNRNVMRAEEQSQIETEREIAIQVEQAVLDLNGAYSSLESAKKRLVAQTLTHKVSQHRFREGLEGALDLQTVSNELLRVRATLLQAEVKWQAARKVVDYYKGIPLLSE